MDHGTDPASKYRRKQLVQMDVFDQENCNKVGQLHAAWIRLENLHHPQDFEDDQEWKRHRSMLNDAQDVFGKVLIDVETHFQSQIRLMKNQMLDATIDFRREWLKMSKDNDRFISMLGQPPSPGSDVTVHAPSSVPSGQHYITEYMENLQVALVYYHCTHCSTNDFVVPGARATVGYNRVG